MRRLLGLLVLLISLVGQTQEPVVDLGRRSSLPDRRPTGSEQAHHPSHQRGDGGRSVECDRAPPGDADADADESRAFEAAEAQGGDASGTRAEQLASIHARKTAALFQAAIVGGAALGGASLHGPRALEQQKTLDAFARDVGIGFQIADDVLDADSEEAASILRLQGIDDARNGAETLLERALEGIEGWGEGAEPLRALARFAIRRRR